MYININNYVYEGKCTIKFYLQFHYKTYYINIFKSFKRLLMFNKINNGLKFMKI